MAMRDYEDMKDIVIPKEQEEMMNIICDAWDECRSLETCKECKDRPKKFMRMAMCNALKYTRKLIEAGYAKHPTADVQEIRHGKWIGYPSITISKRRRTIQSITYQCSCCGKSNGRAKSLYCKNCGSKMCGDKAEAKIKEIEEKK